MEGITDAMKQYSRSTEEIYMNKPKRAKAYGINAPDSISVVSTLTALFLILVLAAEFV